MFDIREFHRPAEIVVAPSVREDVPRTDWFATCRLRGDHWHRRGDLYRKGRARQNASIFGLGGLGLNVIQRFRLVGAGMIICVDINNARKNKESASA